MRAHPEELAMKRERGEEENDVQEQLSDDDFGPRLEDMGPRPAKKLKQKKRVKFEKFYLQVRASPRLLTPSLFPVLKCMKRATCTESLCLTLLWPPSQTSS